MNLQRWITADHDALNARFASSIVRHVPANLWSSMPPRGGSSLTWLLFHMTYHQDLALNTAVRNRAPILVDHRDALGLSSFSASAGLSESENPDVTEAIDLEALLTYAAHVNQTTATWIGALSAMALDSVPDTTWRLENKALVTAQGVPWLHEMWHAKPVAWFIQWECIGHGNAHLGEMTSVRNRLGLSPF